jgi:hypothetical protein
VPAIAPAPTIAVVTARGAPRSTAPTIIGTGGTPTAPAAFTAPHTTTLADRARRRW